MRKITTINEFAVCELGISRDEYAFVSYVLFRAADPRQRVAGWCCDNKDDIAAFVRISRQGLHKMALKMKALDLLEIGAAGAYRATAKFIDIDNECKLSLQNENVNLVYKKCKLSLQKRRAKCKLSLPTIKKDIEEKERKSFIIDKTSASAQDENEPPKEDFATHIKKMDLAVSYAMNKTAIEEHGEFVEISGMVEFSKPMPYEWAEYIKKSIRNKISRIAHSEQRVFQIETTEEKANAIWNLLLDDSFWYNVSQRSGGKLRFDDEQKKQIMFDFLLKCDFDNGYPNHAALLNHAANFIKTAPVAQKTSAAKERQAAALEEKATALEEQTAQIKQRNAEFKNRPAGGNTQAPAKYQPLPNRR